MITIHTLEITPDSQNINVDVEVNTGGFTKILFYDKDTFKETPLAIDISALGIPPANIGTFPSISFTIAPSDVGLTKFTGAFFVEFFAQNSCSAVEVPGQGFIFPAPGDDACDGEEHERLGAVANIVGYKECELDKALSMSIENCEVQEDLNGFAVSTLLAAFDLAFTQFFYEDSIKILNRLDAICKTCQTCPDYGNTVLVNGGSYQTSNNSIILV